MRITIEIEPSKSSPLDLGPLTPLVAPLLAMFMRSMGLEPECPDCRAKEQSESGAQLIFASGPVGPGEVAYIAAIPAAVFVGDRMHVRDDIASHFVIEGCTVDGVTQLIGEPGVGIPASLFAGNARGSTCILDACPKGGRIELRVRNVSDKRSEFHARMFGARL